MNRERGMSLVEVLVALVILAMVTLSIIGLFSQSMMLNASGMDYTTVNNLARDKLEELLSLPFADARLAVTAQTGTAYPNDLGTGSAFVRTYTVREMRLQKQSNANADLSTPVNPGLGNLKEITVTVARASTLFGIGRREIQVRGFKVDGLRF